MTAFRDIVHAIQVQKDGRPLLSRHFGEYSEMLSGPTAQREDVRSCGILEIWDSPTSHTLMQALQYANYLKPFPGDGDGRQDTEYATYFHLRCSPTQITMPFMKRDSVQRNRNSNPERKKSKEDEALELWKCSQSTTFERVVVLMFLIHLSQEVPNTRDGRVLGKRKRFLYFTKTMLNSQKLTFAIQRVIRVWDRVAKSFGFSSVERMLSPIHGAVARF